MRNLELFEERARLFRMLAHAPGLLYVHELTSGLWVSVSGTLGDGLPASEPDGIEPLVDPEDRPILSEHLLRCTRAAPGEVVETELRVGDAAGRTRWIALRTMISARDAEGRPVQSVGTVLEVTERRELADRLRYLGTHDGLTGLYNRAFFDEELDRLGLGRRFPVSVVVADVDELKHVNDCGGHAAGDLLLRRAASIFATTFRTGDVVARVGGDEFAALLPETDEETARVVVERLDTRLDAIAGSGEDEVLLSIGTATATVAHELSFAVEEADRRMYARKAARKAERASRA
jgi:diguanylate cyclase (GGDEF)-like protein